MDEQQRRLNEEGRQIWNTKAAFWDELHGDQGNVFHQRLVNPAVERLLELQSGERILDVACGSGVMARHLASMGAHVTAVDFSSELIERAKARGQTDGTTIYYNVVDATDEQALVELGKGTFDAIICTMALMDMPVIAPLFRAVRQLLTDEGRFVFVTSHPAFHSNNPTFAVELKDQDGQLVTERHLKTTAYLKIAPVKGTGAPNEPAPHYYYHMPLHELLSHGFRAGLVLDAIEEPAFDESDSVAERPLSLLNFWQFPPVLAARMRIGR